MQQQSACVVRKSERNNKNIKSTIIILSYNWISPKKEGVRLVGMQGNVKDRSETKEIAFM